MKHLITLSLTILVSLSYATTNQTLHITNENPSVTINDDVFSDGIRTIDFWFKPDSNITSNTLNEHASLIVRNTPNQAKEWGFYIHYSTGTLNFFRRQNGTNHEIWSDSSTWNNASYYHVVGVIDSVTGMSLYVNGTKQSYTNSSSSPVSTSSYITTIGKWGDLNIRHFSGQIDNVRMWNRALSLGDLAGLSCELTGNQTDSLKLSLNMESIDGVNSKINDNSGLNRHCAYTGTMTLGFDIICLPSNASVVEESSGILVYPNPSSTTFNVQTNGHYTFYELRNSSGKLIQMEQIVPGTASLEIEISAPGTYALIMHNGNTIAVERLVKL